MNYEIPFYRPDVGNIDGIIEDIRPTLEKGLLTNGEHVRRLEEQVAKISGADYAIACSSCTQGLIIALAAAGVAGLGTGQEPVPGFTQSFTWASTAVAINAQHSPIFFFDIDYDTWCVKHYPASDKAAYALAVDTFGMQYSPESEVPIFYDRAHSLGVKFRQMGVASVLSLSPSKLVSGCEGGIILTNKSKFAEAYVNTRNVMSRLSEVHAIIALEGLRSLTERLEWKQACYDLYKQKLASWAFQEGRGNHQVIACLVDTHEQREEIMQHATERGLELKSYYEPLHHSATSAWQLPITDDVASRIICLPSWMGCPRDAIVDIIKEAIE